MVLTSSTMLELGSEAPDFRLPTVDGGEVTLSSFDDKDAFLVIFLSRHCPYVQHIASGLAEFGRDFLGSQLAIVGISSNDVLNFPDDAPEKLRAMAKELDIPFPLAVDESQEVAKSFRAACTPDFFLFDQKRELVYRGQFDDSRPGNDKPVTGRDLREAVTAVLAGREVNLNQAPSVGCNIKWKPGNEPEYFG